MTQRKSAGRKGRGSEPASELNVEKHETRLAQNWITAKAQYCSLNIRTRDGEVERMERVAWNLGVW